MTKQVPARPVPTTRGSAKKGSTRKGSAKKSSGTARSAEKAASPRAVAARAVPSRVIGLIVRHAPSAVAAGLLLTILVYPVTLMLHGPGGSVVGALSAPRLTLWTVLVRVVLVTALAVGAGIGLARPLLGEGAPARSVRLVSAVGAVLGAVVSIADAIGGQAPVALSLLLAVLLLASALYTWFARLPAMIGVHAFIGLALVWLSADVLGSVRIGLPRACDDVYAVSGALLLGASVYGIAVLPGSRSRDAKPAARPGRTARGVRTGPASRRWAAPGAEVVADRLTAVAIVAGVVCAAAASAQLALTGPDTWSGLATGYGFAALARLALPVLGIVLWAAVTRSSDPVRVPASASGVLASAGLVLAFLVSGGLAALAPPPAAPHPGRPLLRPVDLAGRRLSVLVIPMRPGPNLVHIGDSATAGGADHRPAPPLAVAAAGTGRTPVTATTRPGAGGEWALVTIPPGATTLTISGSGRSATVPVDAGSTPGDPAVQRTLAGPDGPECASATLGALMTGATAAPECPAQRLTPEDAAGLRDAVTFLAGHGVRTIDLATDGSPRSTDADRVVRAQAASARVTVSPTPAPNDTLILLSGWSTAPDALDALTQRVTGGATGGAVLAPWLASAPILSRAARELVPLDFDPRSAPARQYTAVLASLFPGELPSPAGFLNWAPGQRGQWAFYGAVQDPPPDAASGSIDQPSPGDWYGSGSFLPVNDSR